MVGSMSALWAAGLAVLATHFVIASTSLRALLVRRLGEGPYRGLFSLIALAAFAWLILAYARAPAAAPVWDLWPAASILALALMPVALILLVGGFSIPNPTAIGGRPAEARVTGVLRITRNPVLWGIGLWAVLHMLANGDPPALAFFGTFAVLALLGSHLIDVKLAERPGAGFGVLALATSNIPFLAIAQGRQSLACAVREFGWLRLATAVLLYAGLLHAHAWLFGIAPYAGL